MAFRSVNPANGNTLGETESFTATQLEAALNAAAAAAPAWRALAVPERCRLLREAAAVLRGRATELASL
ncbi:MAG TPA: aldehyde dehydrogenase family protein, partial [Gammaproteobacteria bacterium]|nr:aldehyde dehydrogenase family protein [Gammaproteobacteria bacterium]